MAYYKVDRSFNVKTYTVTIPVSVSTSNFVYPQDEIKSLMFIKGILMMLWRIISFIFNKLRLKVVKKVLSLFFTALKKTVMNHLSGLKVP